MTEKSLSEAAKQEVGDPHEHTNTFFNALAIAVNVQAWLEALRSGRYLKGIGTLRQDTPGQPSKYCCLGVACDISGMGRWDLTEPNEDYLQHAGEGETYENNFITSEGVRASHAMPLEVQALFGLHGEENRDDDAFLIKLIQLNDYGSEADFNAIADFIEAHFKQENFYDRFRS